MDSIIENNMQKSKYNLVVCELHNSLIHGFDKDSDPNVRGHYLCSYISRKNNHNLSNNISNNKQHIIYDIVKNYKNGYKNLISSNSPRLKHSFIRNYMNIISDKNFIQPHIAEIVYLNGEECVAILKTFWIKCVQRSWKRVYKQRCEIMKLRKHVTSILYKEMHNKWPDYCAHLPSIDKMFWSKTNRITE